MIRSLIHRILKRRHFWRYATFSEIAELYSSRVIRTMALNISATFLSVFMYQNGFSVAHIATYWVCFYAYKTVAALPLAMYVARYGPKHSIFLANLLFIPSMIAYTLIPDFGAGVLWLILLLQGTSGSLYNISYFVDFSKVKSIKHAGKEMAYMNMVEKIAAGLSPVLGGLIAYVASPQATMWTAAVLFALSAVPLLRTAEPIPTHLRLVLRGFPWRQLYRNFVAGTALGFDVVASGTIWSLLVSITIIGVSANSNAVYAILGSLSSVVIVSALLSSYIYGKLIDNKHGGVLLRITAIGNSLTHCMRPFVNNVLLVGGVNIVNEIVTTGCLMSFSRGMFDSADRSGHRVTYFGVMEIWLNMGASMAAGVLLICVLGLGEADGLRKFFFVAAGVILLYMTPRFRLYGRS